MSRIPSTICAGVCTGSNAARNLVGSPASPARDRQRPELVGRDEVRDDVLHRPTLARVSAVHWPLVERGRERPRAGAAAARAGPTGRRWARPRAGSEVRRSEARSARRDAYRGRYDLPRCSWRGWLVLAALVLDRRLHRDAGSPTAQGASPSASSSVGALRRRRGAGRRRARLRAFTQPDVRCSFPDVDGPSIALLSDSVRIWCSGSKCNRAR